MTMMKRVGAAVLAIGLAATGAGVWANQKERTDERAAPAAPIPATPTARSAPAVVARVYGTPITREQLIERCLKEHGAKELDKMIALQVVHQAGARRGIIVTTEDLAAEAETVADRFGINVEEWYRTLERERDLPRPRYLRDVLYPAVMLRRLQASGPATSLESLYESLRREAHIEKFLDAPRRDERGVEKARAGTRSQEDRLRAIERRLDETIQALDRLRRKADR